MSLIFATSDSRWKQPVLQILLRCILQGSAAQDPEPDIVVLVIRVVVVTVGNSGVRSIIVPTTAAFDTVSARGRSHSISLS